MRIKRSILYAFLVWFSLSCAGTAVDRETQFHNTWLVIKTTSTMTLAKYQAQVNACQLAADGVHYVQPEGGGCPDDVEAMDKVQAALAAGRGIVARTDARIASGEFDQTSVGAVSAAIAAELAIVTAELALSGAF